MKCAHITLFLLIAVLCSADRVVIAQELHLPEGFRGGAEISQGRFLVATYAVRDPRFAQSVVLLIRHDNKGTMGLIINRPTKSRVQQLLPDLKELSKTAEMFFYGGPVSADQLFFLLRDSRPPKGTLPVFDDVHITSNVTAAKEWLNGKKAKERVRVFLGYAGWVPGQLAAEILEGSWGLIQADSKSIFEKGPAELWRELHGRTTLRQACNRLPCRQHRGY